MLCTCDSVVQFDNLGGLQNSLVVSAYLRGWYFRQSSA
ncbi:MAG: hypothetical protein OFPII_06180 [Osedax symbiont Rs1]|nr:MAG: hypothetical protein OFPII_06180 [Osedax symbiont Rs1]